MYDVITLGSAIRDLTFYDVPGKIIHTPDNLTAQRLLAVEYGAKFTMDNTRWGFGGGAANTAVNYASHGLKTAIIACVGNDSAGDEVLTNFKKRKVRTDFIQRSSGQTGISVILTHEKQGRDHTLFVDRGASEEISWPKDYRKLKSKFFHMGSLSGKNWKSVLQSGFKHAKKVRAMTAWNPGGVQLAVGKRGLLPLLKLTDILILNKDEAIELVLSGVSVGKRNPKYLNKHLYLLNMLNDWGPRIVVITDGPKGVFALHEGKMYKASTHNIKVIDTTGVGDAFGSGFVTGNILNPNDIEKALRWGVANSESVIRKHGAQAGIMTRSEINKIS
ncbi:hypothetical protein CL634_00510 [bacterium]|nr:hypothetical protein [bacterium]|tara:strand:- start:141 stop:1136 length:996 start_codon:yes stop_codon:yes gene_type:complete